MIVKTKSLIMLTENSIVEILLMKKCCRNPIDENVVAMN